MKRTIFLLAASAVILVLAACGGAAVVRVQINAQTTTIAVTGRTQLSATVTGTSNTAVTWSTANPAVATVDANGIVEANGVPGTVDITATSVADPAKSDTVTLTVGSFSITAVTISATSTTVAVGATLQLTATVTPASAPQGVLWSSADPSVATIDASGTVTGVAVGSVTITARSAADIDVSDQVTINVVASGGGGVTSVVIQDPNPSGPDQVQVGGVLDLDATVLGSAGVSQAVTWTSGAPALATVDGNGTVTGVAAGTVTITATSVADTSVSDSIDIEVIAGSISGVTITNRPPSDSLLVGVSRDLNATVTGSGAFSQDVLWSSSSPGVATVDSTGLVTGVSAGTTVITATAASDASVDDSFTLNVSPASVSCASPTPLTDVSADTTLPLGCYSVAPNDTVSVTAALTLQAGTIVEFGQGARLAAAIGGSITAQGNAGSPVILRGANPSAGFWDGVDIASFDNANSFQHVLISDAGNSNYAGVYLRASGSVSLTNVTIANSTTGLLAQNGGTISGFANNVFSGNTLVADIYPVQMASLDGASDYAGQTATANANNYLLVRCGASGPGTWPATNAPFQVVANGTVTVDAAVTVSPGAQLAFESGARLRTTGSGALSAVGSSGSPIVFRGASATRAFWDGIDIDTVGPNVFDYVEISDAGSGGYAGVYLRNAASVSLSHTTFSGSSVGLQAFNGSTIATFVANTFSDNEVPVDLYPMHLGSLDDATDYAGATATANTKNYVQIHGGNSGAGTWPATNAPLQALANQTVSIDGLVTVAPGAEFTFESGARLRTVSGGTLNASGTSGNRITFRGVTATQGVWDGIDIGSGGANTLDYVDVSDAGDGGYADLYIRSSGSVAVTNSSFNNSATYGIDLIGGGTITPGTVAALTDPGNGNNTFSGNASGPTNGIP